MDNRRNADDERTDSNVKRKSSVAPVKALDLDDVLVNELGQFGRFQLKNFLLVAIPTVTSAFMSEYIFSAAAIPHRCRIPECGETSKTDVFDPEWVLNAIPATLGGFASCQRYVSTIGANNGSLSYCPAFLFDNEVVECNGFVYARDNSVVYDFDLGCQEWYRALAGTLNSAGTLLGLPIVGLISDRFGRRVALVISVFSMALIGLIRAFSVNYGMYLALQILQTTLGAGIVSSAYIFAAELVGPKYRVLMGAFIPSMFSVGQIILGSVAWQIQSWRYMIMSLHVPCFLVITYYWLLSESVRWLLSKERWQEANEVLQKVARVNKTQISDKSLTALMNPTSVSKEGPSVFATIWKSPVLLRRVCTTPVWWVTMTLVYYGLSINSTSLSDTMYLNFILISAIEIPGFFSSVLVLDILGRKVTLSIGFFFSAACNLAFIFIDSEMSTLRLVISLMGKFGISLVGAAVYLYTSELYPTQYRHSLLAFSSMIGRVGSIAAPLTPVLNNYLEGLPNILFCTMGVLSGLLVLTQPETLGTKMPDTLAEAEALGTLQSRTRRASGS